jgi:ribosomal protein S18 acetylase RimI-like enzyme
MRCTALKNEMKIEEIKSTAEHINQLSDLLIKVVDDGASVGFLPPMKRSDARGYWETVLEPKVILFIAEIDGEVAGSVQLHICTKENGSHRAEIAKLMTNPGFRRKGIGRLLMEKAEERAVEERRSLLVLDTREGDPSNLLYQSIGYVEAGKIPGYAKSSNGEYDATVFYYKKI